MKVMQHGMCIFGLLVGLTPLLGLNAGDGDGKWPPARGRVLEFILEGEKWKLTIQHPKNKDEKRNFFLEKDAKIFVLGDKDSKKLEMGQKEASETFKEDIQKGKVYAQVLVSAKDDTMVHGLLIFKKTKGDPKK